MTDLRKKMTAKVLIILINPVLLLLFFLIVLKGIHPSNLPALQLHARTSIVKCKILLHKTDILTLIRVEVPPCSILWLSIACGLQLITQRRLEERRRSGRWFMFYFCLNNHFTNVFFVIQQSSNITKPIILLNYSSHWNCNLNCDEL